MNEDFNWEQAEEAVARARATFEDNAPTAEEAERRNRADQENRLNALKERIGNAIYRLSEEAWGAGNAPTHGLENEMLIFLDEVMGSLNSMSTHEAAEWLVRNLASVERLHAHTERERQYALRVLVGLRGNVDYTSDFLEEISAPASDPDPDPAPTEEEDGGIPWDEGDDDGGEEGFCAAATREIVQAYRTTAMCLREELLARLRKAAALLGWHAAEVVCDPYRHTLNSDIGRFVARAEFCLRGIDPLEAQAWLESNIGEFEALRARNAREYDQAALVLAGLNDRLFGLLYELAREK